MQVDKMKTLKQCGLVVILPLFLLLLTVGGLARIAHAQDEQDDDVSPTNLIVNGNFEEGFYPVPELGFEPPDTGQVPIDWHWYKNSAYGKYTINNREGFGLNCFTDEALGFPNFNALAIDMQSTDQQDARLGVYQTVNVVPGQEYLFSISGTIQSMQGSPEASEDSHKVELVFDHTGGDDWEAIPNEKWTRLPWSEYELEFKTSGPDDPDIARIEAYTTVVKARSDKMTIFLTAYRKWPDWRTVRYTVDCVSLIPLNQAPARLLGLEEEAEAAGPTTAEQLRASSTIVGRSQSPVPEASNAAPAQEPDESVSTDDASAQEPDEDTPAQESDETVPTDETSAEEPDETAPAEESDETAPAEAPAVIPDSGAVLTDEPSETAPAEEPTESTSTEEPADDAPIQELGETIPTDDALAQEPDETAPAEEPAFIPKTGDALTAESPATAPAEAPAVIPDSGGVPAKDAGKTFLIISVSIVILLGLLGAGLWNMLR